MGCTVAKLPGAAPDIAEAEWPARLDDLAARCKGMPTAIHVLGTPRRARLTYRPLDAVAYDPVRGLLSLELGGRGVLAPVRCYIERPIAVAIAWDAARIGVVVADGGRIQTLISVQRRGPVPARGRPRCHARRGGRSAL